jgi:hypothetical protein
VLKKAVAKPVAIRCQGRSLRKGVNGGCWRISEKTLAPLADFRSQLVADGDQVGTIAYVVEIKHGKLVLWLVTGPNGFHWQEYRRR